jgi:ATP-dependent Clp protease ATP-binding subunit ClpC
VTEIKDKNYSFNGSYDSLYEVVNNSGVAIKLSSYAYVSGEEKNIPWKNAETGEEITTETLLLSLLNEAECTAIRLLITLGVDINKLYSDITDKRSMKHSKSKDLIINQLSTDLTLKAKNNELDPVIDRENEINRVIEILSRRCKNNPLLIGPAGVGKTAIVEELSRRIVNGLVPYKLKNMTIYSVSMSILVAGTKYRGEFEERINKLLKEVVNNPNVILFIDEVHTLMGAGGAEGAIDASNIVKPFLARGDIKVIGATTIDEYNKLISNE